MPERPHSKEDWTRAERVLRDLLAIDPKSVEAEIDVRCGGDIPLRDLVREMLLTDTDAEAFVGRIVGTGVARFAEDTDPIVSTEIGPYRVLRRIGEGGMSVVYLAERADALFERRVCLKLVKRGMDTEAVLRRFQYERQILAELDHPNIARLYDGGSTPDGRPYFVMEFIDGLPIDRFCDERNYGTDARIDIFRTVCAAVHFAHQNLIVHRDLKPANILVTDDGVPKLLDFGIATLLGPDDVASSGTTGVHRFLTPAYASPEQLRGERVTTATDVYSLSTLLYQILTRTRPFPTQNRSDLEQAIREEAPLRPSEVAKRAGGPHVPTDLDNIVGKGMDKVPNERYATANDLAEDLVRHQTGLPIAARSASTGYRLWKFAQRNKTLVGALLALILFAVSMTVQSIRVTRARDTTAKALAAAETAQLRSTDARDRAEETARLLAEVIDVADPNVSYREAEHNSAMNFGTGSFSIAAWIRLDQAAPGATTILDKRVPPFLTSRGLTLFLYDGRLGLQIADGVLRTGRNPSVETSGDNYVGKTDLADNQWHHVAASVRRDPKRPDSAWLGLFVDGALDMEWRGRDVRDGDISNEAPLRIGFENDGFHIANPLRGNVREPEIYDLSLDPRDIATLHRWGRRHLTLDGAYVSPVAGTPGETISTSLVIVKRSQSPRTYTWTVAGIAIDSLALLGPTQFSPTSGTLHLEQGPREAIQPIRVLLPAHLSGDIAQFVASISDADSRDRLQAVGTIHLGNKPPRDRDEKTAPRASLAEDVATAHMDRDRPLPLDLSFDVRLRPNEMFSDASIRFGIGSAEPIEVEIEVVDLSGAVVREFSLGRLSNGQHSVTWDGKDESGKRMENGIYAITILGRGHRMAHWDEESGSLRRIPAEVLQRKIFHLR